MTSTSLTKWAMALVLLALLAASAYPAFATSYTIKGSVVDINGKGVPGAKVTLEQGSLQISDPIMTANDGSYIITLDSLMSGDYMLFGEKDGKQSSTLLKVGSGYINYTASPIMLRNYIVSDVPATPTPAPTATPTPTPTATAVPDNATATPTATVEATPTATPVPTPTPAPTPGFGFILVPAALALCYITLRAKN